MRLFLETATLLSFKLLNVRAGLMFTMELNDEHHQLNDLY